MTFWLFFCRLDKLENSTGWYQYENDTRAYQLESAGWLHLISRQMDHNVHHIYLSF